MPYNILLLPLLGGFIFITRWNRSRWHALRADKERLLFYAGLAGLFWLSIAFVVSSIPPFIPCVSWLPCAPLWWARHIPFPYCGTSVFAFVLGATMWWPLNRGWNREEADAYKKSEADRIIKTEGGPFEQLMDRAMQQQRHVLITLKNGKVYVGRIGSAYTPGQRDQTIHLLPTISGYRGGIKQRVEFTTYYDDAYESIKKDHPEDYADIIKDFIIVMPTDQILTISLYRYDVHEKYFQHKEPPE